MLCWTLLQLSFCISFTAKCLTGGQIYIISTHSLPFYSSKPSFCPHHSRKIVCSKVSDLLTFLHFFIFSTVFDFSGYFLRKYLLLFQNMVQPGSPPVSLILFFYCTCWFLPSSYPLNIGLSHDSLPGLLHSLPWIISSGINFIPLTTASPRLVSAFPFKFLFRCLLSLLRDPPALASFLRSFYDRYNIKNMYFTSYCPGLFRNERIYAEKLVNRLHLNGSFHFSINAQSSDVSS